MRALRHRILARGFVVPVAIAFVSVSCAGEPTAQRETPSGTPVLVGFINQEGTPRGSIPQVRAGAEAAVEYVNAELDGVQGRPIEFRTCITNGSPESSTACANEMVEHGVVAVLVGVDLGSAASLPILTGAGIPAIVVTPLLPADFTTDGAFTLDPGGLGNAANAAYAVDELEAERVSVLYADEPAGRQLAEAFVRPVLLDRGIPADSIMLVAERADAADLSPAVAAAAQPDPDAVIVVFPPPACSRIMQAAGTLGVEAPMFYIGRCGDAPALGAGGPGAEGTYSFSPILNVDAHPDDPDVRVYSTKVEQFGGSDADPASFDTARGFATTMTTLQRLATIEPEDISSSTITAAFRSAVDVPAFMGHPYTCDGRQAIPTYVSLCNNHVRIYRFEDGRSRDALGDWMPARVVPAR